MKNKELYQQKIFSMESSFTHIRLSDTFTPAFLRKFKCSDTYLNQFLERRARKHQNELLAVTYLVFNEQTNLIGYYTLSSDSMPATDVIRSKFTNGKLYHSYPAIKIGRFAIDGKYKGFNYGSIVMDFIKYRFANIQQEVASRYLLVDAYNNDKVLSFYKEKNNFEFWTKEDKDSNTRLMYYDLMKSKV